MMDHYPIWDRARAFLVAIETGDEHQSNEPLGPNAGFTFSVDVLNICLRSCLFLLL